MAVRRASLRPSGRSGSKLGIDPAHPALSDRSPEPSNALATGSCATSLQTDAMSDIEQTLHHLERRLVDRDRLTHRLTAATNRVAEVRRRRAHLAEVLQSEDADVARLEGATLTALLRTMLSDKETQ